MDDLQTDIHELSGKSPEFRTHLAQQLEELVPEAIADGKVDVAKLKELLDEDAGDTNERFGLFWPGKKRAMRAAQDPTTATLKPAKDLSKEWGATQNIFIEGDNLEVLKVLQKQYHNSIKMIYIDPPYNTGKDFVYPDNFKEGLQNYLEFSKQVDEGNKKISTNTETTGRYHSNWLNMMYPRLKLARNLLTDDGVIFVSIDDNEQPHLRKLCDEVFGESNFIEAAVVKRSANGMGSNLGFASNHDYVLVYSRNTKANDAKFIGLRQSSEYKNKFNEKDAHGIYKVDGIFRKKGAGSRRQDSPGCFYPIFYNPSSGTVSLTRSDTHPNEVYPKLPNGDDGRWIWSPEFAESRIYRLKAGPSGTIYVKDYYDINSRVKPRSILESTDYLTDKASNEIIGLFGSKLELTPKPIKLIVDLVDNCTVKNSIVLDFFSGSGTTAHAVMQLNAEDGGNRKHIQVQLPEPTDEKSEAYKAGYRKISDIARARIDKAGESIKEKFADKLAERDTPLDVGYRTYQLADTNFRKWQSSATGDLGELQTRLDLMRESADDNASEEDLLVEVMLKMGLPLTSRTELRNIAGLHVYQVVSGDDEHSDVQPVFYLNEHVKPTLEQLRAIVTELTPSKFVILDDAFQGDNELKTNLVQTCKSYDVELWTV